MNFKSIATRYAGDYAEKQLPNFSHLKKPFEQSGLRMLFKTYVSMMFFYPAVSALLALPAVFLVCVIIKVGVLMSIVFSLLGAALAGGLAFGLFYMTPSEKSKNRRRNIEANLPFAVNHMAAISTSGVPPSIMFKLLSEFGEYEEISKEAAKIIRNTESFGQDITTSISQVAENTPSNKFKELLYGILSVIKTGGNLNVYLSNQAEKALFDYKISRGEYLETLSTYADFYTAVLIAAPLFLIAILAVMNIIGGSIGGLTIQQILSLSVFVMIPLVNMGFLGFIHATQPEQV